MHNLKAIFICSNCGEVDGESYEAIDTERDSVEYHTICSKCGRPVEPKLENGVQCYRTMSQEEVLAEQGFYDPVEELDDDWYDDGPGDDWEDEYQEALDNCGQGQGYSGCRQAGTEYCDFECPFRDELFTM